MNKSHRTVAVASLLVAAVATVVASMSGIMGGIMGGDTSGRPEADADRAAVIDAALRGINTAQNAISVDPRSGLVDPFLVEMSDAGAHRREYLSLPADYQAGLATARHDVERFLAGRAKAEALARNDEWVAYLPGIIPRLVKVAADPINNSLLEGDEAISYILASGGKDLKVVTVEFGENSAQLTGSVLLWSSGVGIGSGQLQVYSPTGISDVEIELVREDSTWKVSDLSMTPRAP
ncbi:hypothetical protein RB608_05595 [Nocardioides sp. LHD-245]|uniref:hypothetical protein n=1 Tax=Nocardioides sp. LHD-245 TaxID=3051387 RepID=UPI0027E0B9D8|nr:hypothetical protein [Nocardioides sp. LHD-245]